VTQRRASDDETDFQRQERQYPVLVAGSLMAGETSPANGKHMPAHPDERLSLFWRVFGGTILSIAALIAITLYNSQATAITELRAEVSRLNEARAELVKKEEFNSSKQAMWDRLQGLQELRVTVTALKEQVSAQNEKSSDIKGMTDKLTGIEQRLRAAEDDHKALAKAELSITALEQKLAGRETQLRTAEEERREMARQLQELRERLAKVEGLTEAKPMPKAATEPKK
jgi:chromosome segregation ATPase